MDTTYRRIWPYCIMVALAVAGCAAEPEPEDDVPAPNPIERRLDPARRSAAQADSALRAREQEARELTGEPGR